MIDIPQENVRPKEDSAIIKHPVLFLFFILAAVAIILAAAYLIYLNFEIVDEGKILPYTDKYIYEISIGKSFNFYFQPELKLSDDIINSVVLLGVSYISMTFAIILIHRGGASRHVIRFLSLLSLAMFYIAADESFGLHESLGHNMQFLAKIPGMKNPDDFIVIVFGLIFASFLFYFRSVYMNKRRPLIYFGCAVALAALAAISDPIEFRLEEVVEIGVAVCLLCGTVSLGLSILDETYTTPVQA